MAVSTTHPRWPALHSRTPGRHRITGNPASLKLLGLPERANGSATSPDHEPNKRGFQEYRGNTPIPPNELPVQRAARGELVNGAEVKYVFDDGRVRYIYGNAVPLRNPEGRVRGCVAAFADVTPLKEAEESLRRATEQLRIVTDSMAAPVTRCIRDLQYLWVSKTYSDWLNRPTNEIIDHPILDIIGPQAFEDRKSVV